MILLLATAGGLLLALCGLAAVRSATPGARWLASVVVVAFAVVAAVADRTSTAPVPTRAEAADLDGDRAQQDTAALLAAGKAGPRADELTLRWRGPAKGAPPSAALGAATVAPTAMPFAPEDVRIEVAADAEVERPALLELTVSGEFEPVQAELTLRDLDGDVLRRPVMLTGAPVQVPFRPSRAGRHEVTLSVSVGANRLSASGSFEVAPPAEVLVVEPSGVVAAALRAQGERVREERAWPIDWNRHRRVVLGEILDVDQQRDLVDAVRDGLGLFVLGAAFGPEGAPLRAVLPVRPLPPPPDEGDRPGGGVAADDVAQPPKEEPPQVAPPPPERIGDTAGAKPISEDPVEVDKHAIAMVLVVDRSGSMGATLADGMTKMGYAKTSALRTAQALGEGDRVGLVTFGDRGAGRIELPLTDAADRGTVQAGIEKLAARAEMTFLLSGLRSAHALLRDVDAAVKQVVVISDGEFWAQDLALTSEAAKMRRDSRVTLSIIGVVTATTDPDFKRMVGDIAQAGGGLPLLIDDPGKIVQVVSGEVTRALSRVGRKPNLPGDGDEPPEPQPPEPDEPDEPDEPEEPEEPEPEPEPEPERPTALPVIAVAESPLLAPEPDEWPSLGAAIACEAPLDSRVLLVVGEQGWPLLSYANRGLGRVGAFAADLGGAGSSAFREARAFPAWLAQWLAVTEAADASVEGVDVRDGGGVEPDAPVPDDLAFLQALGGAVTRPVDAPATPAGEVVGSAVTDQVAQLAPLLLPLLLLLALAERWLGARALRRGAR